MFNPRFHRFFLVQIVSSPPAKSSTKPVIFQSSVQSKMSIYFNIGKICRIFGQNFISRHFDCALHVKVKE